MATYYVTKESICPRCEGYKFIQEPIWKGYWEWTEDFNSVLTTNDSRTAEYDDKGLFCASAATTATDVLNYASFMRYAFRQSLKANYTVANLGFRCAKDLTTTK